MRYNTSIIATMKNKYSGVKITSDSTTNSGSLPILVDFWSSGVWVSDQVINRSFVIDLGNRFACVERYALRFYYNDHYPLSWSVYGSYDGSNWALIDHEDDDICAEILTYRSIDNCPICGIYAAKMYEARNRMCCRFIKVQQDGKNSGSKYTKNPTNKWHDAFYLNGFEAFGRIRRYCFYSYRRCNFSYIVIFLISLFVSYN